MLFSFSRQDGGHSRIRCILSRSWSGLGLILFVSTPFGAFASREIKIQAITPPSRSDRYEEILKEIESLPKKFPESCATTEIGKSKNGKKILGVEVFSPSAHSTPTENAPTILITGGIHGNEYLGFEHRLPEWFLSEMNSTDELQTFFSSGGRVLFVPLQNPDGFIQSVRTNANGKDLNRNFPRAISRSNKTSSEPEVKAVTQWLNQGIELPKRNLKIAIDYHCCTGALLYPTSPRGALARSIASAAATKKRSLDPNFSDLGKFFSRTLKATFGNHFRVGRSSDILGYQAVGTAKDYFSEKYRALSLTFEGLPGDGKNSITAQTDLWVELLGGLNAGKL
jgi:hypothetical protein